MDVQTQGLEHNSEKTAFPDDLTLQWMFADACKLKLLGKKGQTFAIELKDNNIALVGSSQKNVKNMSFFNDFFPQSLLEVQKLNGSFWVEGDKVVCKIDSTVVSGPDYIRAGMLAVARYHEY